jgi:hypothetical protein
LLGAAAGGGSGREPMGGCFYGGWASATGTKEEGTPTHTSWLARLCWRRDAPRPDLRW